VDVAQTASEKYIQLELNMKWLTLAHASTPLTLKNVAVQESVNFIPVSQIPEIKVQISEETNKKINSLNFVVTGITKEMREGVRTLQPVNDSVAVRKLVLIHGYCAGENPFQPNAAQFTDAVFFSNPNANLGNNAFAQKVADFVNSQGITSFGAIGHSQGGMVGLHLLNYFETGLDFATGGVKLQSLGTPYNGCSAAGSSANLGKAFGVGCGSNTDLSVDGAKLWLAGITAESRKEVNYYTTSYEQGSFFGDYCNMAINAVLEWPNDGTTEIQYASLSGATSKGNTQKQCHTTGMKYTAQYLDNNRNKAMNTAAAR